MVDKYTVVLFSSGRFLNPQGLFMCEINHGERSYRVVDKRDYGLFSPGAQVIHLDQNQCEVSTFRDDPTYESFMAMLAACGEFK